MKTSRATSSLEQAQRFFETLAHAIERASHREQFPGAVPGEGLRRLIAEAQSIRDQRDAAHRTQHLEVEQRVYSQKYRGEYREQGYRERAKRLLGICVCAGERHRNHLRAHDFTRLPAKAVIAA